MFKVSFRGPFKKVERFDKKVTIVTIRSESSLFAYCAKYSISKEIVSFALNHGVLPDGSIVVQGMAIRNGKDAYSPITGERIAEARAKIKLYKMLMKFFALILKAYNKELYGTDIINAAPTDSSKVHSTEDCILNNYLKYKALLSTEQQHLNKLTI